MYKNKRLMNLFIVIMLTTNIAAACARTPTQPTAQVIWPVENWQSSPPEAQGMDLSKLVQMFETIQEDDIRLHSLLVVRNGYLVTEAYWAPYGPGQQAFG